MKASLEIAADIRRRIANGDLSAGDPLPVESALMEQLGASKGTVREALRILEGEGLVEVRRGLGGGPRVRHPSIAETAQAMAVYLQIGDVLVTDVCEARDRMITNAVGRLAEARAEIDTSALDASVRELAALVGDFDAFYPQLLDVGETAVRLSGNKTESVLVSALRHIITAELEAATRTVIDVDLALAAEEHVVASWTETYRHIRAGHAQAARRTYARHAELTRNALAIAVPDTTVVDLFSRIMPAVPATSM